MLINFRQGIIQYPFSGPLQIFLTKTGVYVNLSTTNGIVDVAFAHKDRNYLLTETNSVTNAWGPIPASTNAWLYWDINLLTGVRTFGFTLLQPFVGPLQPNAPQEDQHWFNTAQGTMFVRQNNRWREVVRVFAARNNNGNFFPLGSIVGAPYAGSQVGITGNNVPVGRIVYDDNGMPIRRQNGTFFTSEDQFYINGSPANTIRFEANVLTAQAAETIPSYHVVKVSAFNQMELAGYNDLNETFIGMSVESVNVGDVFTLISQGTVTNPQSISNPTGWAWTTPGAPLWVLENGQLVDVDPHVTDVITYPNPKPPIGRVISPDTIFFDQGLGGKGEQGNPATVDFASNSVFGITRLSVAPAAANNPIAVGDNDPRNTNARTPTAHTHPADQVITSPYGGLTGATLNLQLQEINDEKLNLTGGTLTGSLILFGNPTVALEAATKQYVDQRGLNDLSDVTLTAPTSSQILSYNGSTWVNSTLPTVTEPLNQLVYGTGTGVDSSPTLTYDASILTLTIGVEDQENIIKSVDATTTNTAAGDLRIYGGNGNGTGQGANVTVLPGAGGETGNGGSLSLSAGAGGNTSGNGGDVGIFGGTPIEGNGGSVIITGTPASGVGTYDGGDVILNTGSGVNGGVDGIFEIVTNANSRLIISGTGDWNVGGSTGAVGEVLTSNGVGTPPSWQPGGGGGVSEPANQVVYGTGGSVTSSSTFTYNESLGLFQLQPTPVPIPGDVTIEAASTNIPASNNGGNLTLRGGAGANAGHVEISGGNNSVVGLNGTGGNVLISGGDAAAINANGGYVQISGGSVTALAGTGFAGNVFVRGGDNSNNTGPGGAIQIAGGDGTNGSSGGPVSLTGGNSTSDSGGFVQISTGNTGNIFAPLPYISLSTANGGLTIEGTGAYIIAGTAGTAGDVLTSNGPGTGPSWQPAGGGGGGGGAISALTAAVANNTINNGDWLQAWQWSLNTQPYGLRLTESAPSVGGTILRVDTLNTSGASPFEVMINNTPIIEVVNTGALKFFTLNGAVGRNLTITLGNGTTSTGGQFSVTTGGGSTSSGSGNGGPISLNTGSAVTGNGNGGDITLATGNSIDLAGFGRGGNVFITCGGSNNGGGGGVNVKGGYGATGGGHVAIEGGEGDGTGGGNVTIDGGTAFTGNGGRIRVRGGNIAGGTNIGNVAIGRGTISTTRDGDFMYVPSSAGPPTGTPEAIAGLVPMVVDTTTGTGVLYFYIAGTWRQVSLT